MGRSRASALNDNSRFYLSLPAHRLNQNYGEERIMSTKFTDLQCKEVICVSNGQRLGFVGDVLVEVPDGNVCAIGVPAPCKGMNPLGRRDDYIIPWKCIQKIGPDIVLVDAKPNECRVPRTGKRLPL